MMKDLTPMKLGDFVVGLLVDKGVSDVFGLPGGVVLGLLYALDNRKDEIKTHLMQHEQSAVYAAAGFAKSSGKVGVAYVTRGPGFTNALSAITDAYCDSTPVIVFTGHSSNVQVPDMRVFYDQEIDTVSIVQSICKLCLRIDDIADAKQKIVEAFDIAKDGRPGPVVVDIDSSLYGNNINLNKDDLVGVASFPSKNDGVKYAGQIIELLITHKRPVLFVGDGFRNSASVDQLIGFAERSKIPILSSRFVQDLFSGTDQYFGYIGSHGLRSGNFILSKADLIIGLGNRMVYPTNSKTWAKISAKFVRVDIDQAEFGRNIPDCLDIHADLKDVVKGLGESPVEITNFNHWSNICSQVSETLSNVDSGFPIEFLRCVLDSLGRETTIVSDVGNNEFWLCRAYAMSSCRSRMLFSKSFGAMGSSIGKAIGVYYATKEPVVCFIGDQALQMCTYDLHFVSEHSLPITIVLLNNEASGMIRSRELARYGDRFIQTTIESGYTLPNLARIAQAYGLECFSFNEYTYLSIKSIDLEKSKPLFIELCVDSDLELIPSIPSGNPMQQMTPKLKDAVFKNLDRL